LLEQGSGGVDEMRDAIAKFWKKQEKEEPVFGAVRLKRRKILVKVVVEGASRLIRGEWTTSLPVDF
jgi:hypothetical protein